jgi:hypothetical protein
MPDPDDEQDDRPRRRPRREDDEDEDDRPRRRRRRDAEYYDEDAAGDDAGLQYIVPVNTNVLAIAAGYLGLVSVLCAPAPFALVVGILALRSLKRNPKQHGKGRAIFGVVMGGLFTAVILAFLGLWAANGFN